MKSKMFVITPGDRAPALNVLGTEVTVLAPNAATGSYEITLQRGGEGQGDGAGLLRALADALETDAALNPRAARAAA